MKHKWLLALAAMVCALVFVFAGCSDPEGQQGQSKATALRMPCRGFGNHMQIKTAVPASIPPEQWPLSWIALSCQSFLKLL